MTQLTIPDSVLSQTVDGEVVLLNLNDESYFGLNEVGSRFWQHIQAGHTWEETLNSLLEGYDVSRDTLQDDLKELADTLAEAGLLQDAPSTSDC